MRANKLIVSLISTASAMLGLIIIFSKSAIATQCFFVSGLSRDNMDVLAQYKAATLNRTLTFRYYSCTQVDSWKDLEALLKKDAQNAASGKDRDNKILILQIAHGLPGGVSLSDAGDEGGDAVFSTIKRIAKTHRVGVISQSCYSGDLLARKLVSDELATNDKSIDQMCLMVASSFGSPAFATDGMYQLLHEYDPNTESMLSLSKNASLSLSSAAPWAGSKLVDKLWPYYMANGIEKTKNINERLCFRRCSAQVDANKACEAVFSVLDSLLRIRVNPNISNDDRRIAQLKYRQYKEDVKRAFWPEEKKDRGSPTVKTNCPMMHLLMPWLDALAQNKSSLPDINIEDVMEVAGSVDSLNADKALLLLFGIWSSANSATAVKDPLDVRRQQACANF
jgi:hypothetical protein